MKERFLQLSEDDILTLLNYSECYRQSSAFRLIFDNLRQFNPDLFKSLALRELIEALGEDGLESLMPDE